MASVTTDRRQGVSSSAAVKVACRAASTVNLTLSGEQTVDGIAIVTNDRVFVKNQTDATENGIYDANTSDWTRSPDWDGAYDVQEGTLITSNNGTINGDTMWRVTTTGTITVGTSILTFEKAAVSDSSTVAYTPTGTGAVPSTVQTKLRESVTPEDFGAVGDGVTDDYTALANAYTAHIAQGVPLILLGKTYATGTGLVWASNNALILGAGKKVSVIKRLAGIASGTPTIHITPGDWGVFRDFSVDNNSIDGNGIHLYLSNESTFSSITVDNVTAGYAFAVQQSSSNNWYDIFCNNCDKILRVYNVSNQLDFYDVGGIGTSTTEAAYKLENSFRLNFFGGIIEHDGRGVEIGSDIDGVAFNGTYIESLNTSAALSDILIGEATGGNTHAVSFDDCYITQNADKGAPCIELTADARNVKISGGRISRSIAGTDSLITFIGSSKYVKIENIDTWTVSACLFIDAGATAITGLTISNVHSVNAANTIDVNNANGCQIFNTPMNITVGSTAARVDIFGATGTITDNSSVARQHSGSGLLDLNGGILGMAERTNPGAPSANGVYVWTQDDGGGKTQIVARFNTGAVQVIATEP